MAKENAAPAKRRPRWKRVLICVLAAAAALLAVYCAGVRVGGQQAEPVVTSELIGQQLRSASELVSVDYHYTNMGKFENRLDFYGWSVPFTAKSFIVSYDGVVKAGVDLGQVKADVDESAKTVTVTLPDSRIISHEIDEDSIQVFDESDNIFNHITIDDYTGFTRDQKAAVEQKAVDSGLLTAASDRARETVASLLSLMPGMDGYTLTVK